MRKRRGIGRVGWWLFGLVLLTGCSRDDTEHLSRIGKILGQRVDAALGDLGDDFLQRWQQGKDRRQHHQLARQINKLLADDPNLTNCKIQVLVEGDQVELRGTVHDMQQRRRVMELAGSVTGAGKLKDNMKSDDDAQ